MINKSFFYYIMFKLFYNTDNYLSNKNICKLILEKDSNRLILVSFFEDK